MDNNAKPEFVESLPQSISKEGSSSPLTAQQQPTSASTIEYDVHHTSTPDRTVSHLGSPSRELRQRTLDAPAPSEPELGEKVPFSLSKLDLLVSSKDMTVFQAFSGVAGLEKGLQTDRRCGLSSEETHFDDSLLSNTAGRHAADHAASTKHLRPESIARTFTASSDKQMSERFLDRRRVFGDNTMPTPEPSSFFQTMWATYNDYVLFILTAAATISLGIGLYQAFGTPRTPSNPPVEWVEGVAILVAIAIIVLVGSINDWQKARHFAKLNKKKRDRDVKVIRSGVLREIPIVDVLVGDVVYLEPGEVVPADGILISGHNIGCDESWSTGESDLVIKHPGDEAFKTLQQYEHTSQCIPGDIDKLDPFILSGTKIVQGIGTFLVTATGRNSSYGMATSSQREDAEFTPLQVKLNKLAKYIAKIGGIAALVLFVVLFIKFLVQLPHNSNKSASKGQQFLNILILALTVLVIAVPEGLPLAVTLALAFATTKMLKDNNLVRQLKSCEIMGNATAICSDKTGTLTQNKMTVFGGTIGTSSRFNETVDETSSGLRPNISSSGLDGVSISECIGCISTDVKAMLRQSIAINSTAFENEEDGRPSFTGSKTETALLKFAHEHLGMGSLNVERFNANVVEFFSFDAVRKCTAAIVQMDNRYRVYVKGASELLLDSCTRVLRDPTKEISDVPLTPDSTESLRHLIATYAARSLRTITLAYRDIEKWPPTETQSTTQDKPAEMRWDDILQDLVFFGLVGIEDPLRDGARAAVKACQSAGVVVRMVTGDNILTAKAVAEQCGILSANDIAMEGSEFRQLSMPQMKRVVGNLKVIARSSPEDKQTLVRLLKDMGETVAVTGDGTNDAFALVAADVGFSMGISGTEVAREASSIVLLDDNFSSIVKAIMWGRAINDAVKKFLQFQIIVSITSVLLTFISAAASSGEKSVLTAVQLMWVNLFQDTMAALALATDPPTSTVMDRKPDRKSAPLISAAMWKMILGQSTYQVAVTLILWFGGTQILSYQSVHEQEQLPTLVFNTYVWLQIFNMYNTRRADNEFNIFEGIFRNWFFVVINLIMIGTQVMIMFVGGRAFSITRLNPAQWAYSLVLGAMSIPVGVIIRLIPESSLRNLGL